jgi:hypothetical protein
MSAKARRLVRRRAGFRCEYCHIREQDLPEAFHLEHVIAKKHSGADHITNLAWSCHRCNLGKGANLAGRVGGAIVALFHPRRQNWRRHFKWVGPILKGKTKCGRATVRVLNINEDNRVRLRILLMAAGVAFD